MLQTAFWTASSLRSAHSFEEILISANDASLNFGLAPLRLRRDIAMLGLLHKVRLGLAHPCFSHLFLSCPNAEPRYLTKSITRRHHKQLIDKCGGQQPGYLGRSFFCFVRVYNALSQEVDCSTVSSCRSSLTQLAKAACKADADNWDCTFSSFWRR